MNLIAQSGTYGCLDIHSCRYKSTAMDRSALCRMFRFYFLNYIEF